MNHVKTSLDRYIAVNKCGWDCTYRNDCPVGYNEHSWVRACSLTPPVQKKGRQSQGFYNFHPLATSIQNIHHRPDQGNWDNFTFSSKKLYAISSNAKWKLGRVVPICMWYVFRICRVYSIFKECEGWWRWKIVLSLYGKMIVSHANTTNECC